MAEYAWQQPDGEIAPVLATDGYDLMINIGGDWVRVADLVKLALKPGQFTACPAPLTGEALDAERRGHLVDIEDQVCPRCHHYSLAHIAAGCSLDDCPCEVSWARLRG